MTFLGVSPHVAGRGSLGSLESARFRSYSSTSTAVLEILYTIP